MTRPTAHFSPHGGCTEAIVAAIAGARLAIRFLAYSFTSELIADALIAANGRGVDVRGVVDAKMVHGRGEQSHRMNAAGLDVMADDKHPIAHQKTYVIDRLYVITGSFNASAQAEVNSENIVIIRDEVLAADYIHDWSKHRDHAIALPAPLIGAELPWVEISGSLADGWRVFVNGVAVGPTVADHRDIIPVVRWLRAALGELEDVLAPGDAEGSIEP